MHAIGLFIDARFDGEISQPEALVLMRLSGSPGTTINDLHHAFLHRRSTLTSVLDRLEGKGLVERTAAESDRRSIVVRLTARGKRAAGSIEHAFAELQTEISERDIARVHALAEAAARIAADG